MTQISPLILRDIHRTFMQADQKITVLNGVNLTISPGEIVALVGPSGTGKSTLLQIAGLLEPPSAGEIILAGKIAQQLSDDVKTTLRRTHIGFVYQFHHLLPEFNALENVIIPQLINRVSPSVAHAHAHALLEKLGLAHRLTHFPKKLSGGEQQRVAIARALANNPQLLLADEPTGNLDVKTSDRVFNAMLELVRETGLSALIATHNPELAQKMDRVLCLEEGRLHA